MTQISKLDAGRRQLDEAIQLWMDARDPLAVHTLTMAAFTIFYDMTAKVGYRSNHDPLESYLKARGQREFRKITNFLKHADKDHLTYFNEPDLLEHEHRIGFALLLYRELAGQLTERMGAFHLMSLVTYPDHFCVAHDADPKIEDGARRGAELARTDPSVRRAFAKAFLVGMKDGILSPNGSVRRLPGIRRIIEDTMQNRATDA